MKNCNSRYLIGGEGIPSRDHIGQGEERENETTCGFKLAESGGKCSTIQKLYNIYIHVCGCQ
jgi:hypothetical protein